MKIMSNNIFLLALLLYLSVHQATDAFLSGSNSPCHSQYSHPRQSPAIQLAKRYGPPGVPSSNTDSSSGNDDSIKLQFTKLLHQVVSSKGEETPSLLTRNIDTILTAMKLDLLEEIIQDELNSHPPDEQNTREERLEELSNAVDMIVTFVESFVDEAKSMEDVYKKLLGRIFKIIAKKENNQMENDSDVADTSYSAGTSADMEAALDRVLAEESEAFTPGFLRHLEGECERIANLPTMSPESSKMLQILRVIQTRVLEELGKEIGEGAIVLGQLLGYDDKSERLAVLDAGLTVRGTEFACELSALTGEALKGFEAIKDVDPGLVQRIKEIDERIGVFMEKNRFQ